MPMKGAEVRRYIFLLFHTDVKKFLVAEYDAATLRDNEGELVQPFFRKICDLYALKFGPAVRTEFEDIGRIFQ